LVHFFRLWYHVPRKSGDPETQAFGEAKWFSVVFRNDATLGLQVVASEGGTLSNSSLNSLTLRNVRIFNICNLK
jgi:hypothetical protein